MAPVSLGKSVNLVSFVHAANVVWMQSLALTSPAAIKSCVCVSCFSSVWFFAAPWSTAREAPLSMGFSRQELERVAISFSWGSSWPRDHTHISYVSCIGRQVLYHWATSVEITTDNFKQGQMCWLWCCWYCLLWTTHTHTLSHTGSQHSTIFLAIPCIACSLEPFVFHW